MLKQEKNCYLGINGKKHGPLSEADIQKLYDNKKITGDTKFARLGDTKWISVSEVGIFTPPLPDDDGILPLPIETRPIRTDGAARDSEKMSRGRWLAIFGGTIAVFAIVLVVAVVVLTPILDSHTNTMNSNMASSGLDGSSGNSGSNTPIGQQATRQNSMNVAGFELSNLEYEVLFGIGVVRYSFRNTTNQPINAMFQTEILDTSGERIGRAGATDMFNPAHQPRTTHTVTSEMGDVTRDTPVYGVISVILFNEMGFPDIDNISPENRVFFEFLPNGQLSFFALGQEPNFAPNNIDVGDDYTMTTGDSYNQEPVPLTEFANVEDAILGLWYIHDTVVFNFFWGTDVFFEPEGMGASSFDGRSMLTLTWLVRVDGESIILSIDHDNEEVDFILRLSEPYLFLYTQVGTPIILARYPIADDSVGEATQNEGTATTTQHDIIGRWTLTLGNSVSTFDFRADGTYVNTGSSPLGTLPTGTGRFEVVGDTIIITRDRDGTTSVLNIVGNELFMGDSITPYRRVSN